MNEIANINGAKPAVEFSNLTKTFGATIALDNVAGKFHAGRLTGIVGPDGAGKTTLMRILATLLKPDNGNAIVEINYTTPNYRDFKVGTFLFKSNNTHLIKNGYKRIAHLSNSEYLSITKERQAGYKKALEDCGVVYDENLVKHCLHGGMIYEEVEDAMNKLLKLKQKPDAVFASADKLTTNCMRYCKTKKIAIPKTLAVIGFSNLDLTELLSPSLSVVRQPAFEMGRIAAELLIKMIEAKRATTDFEIKMLQPDIFVRDSSVRNVK